MKSLRLFLVLLFLGAIIATACTNQKELATEEIISNQNYMADCEEGFGSSQDKQVGFKNLFPGLSKVDDAKTLVGDPVSVEKSIPYSSYQDMVDKWNYNDSRLFLVARF